MWNHFRAPATLAVQSFQLVRCANAMMMRGREPRIGKTLTPSLPPPASSVTATAIWNTTAFTDGIYTLTAGAEDVARNAGMATRVLVADNTAPETFIDAGPSGQIPAGNATFSFSGSDNQTAGPSLVFAWRLDSGPWSPFSADTSATFSELNLGVFDQSDLLMLVCEPDVTSLKVMQSTLDTFAALQIPAEKRVLVLNETFTVWIDSCGAT